jgi:hypothetical protein
MGEAQPLFFQGIARGGRVRLQAHIAAAGIFANLAAPVPPRPGGRVATRRIA